jgi:hypothetical protein
VEKEFSCFERKLCSSDLSPWSPWTQFQQNALEISNLPCLKCFLNTEIITVGFTDFSSAQIIQIFRRCPGSSHDFRHRSPNEFCLFYCYTPGGAFDKGAVSRWILFPFDFSFSLFFPSKSFLRTITWMQISEPLSLATIKPPVLFKAVPAWNKSDWLERIDCCIWHICFCPGPCHVVVLSNGRTQLKWPCAKGFQTFDRIASFTLLPILNYSTMRRIWTETPGSVLESFHDMSQFESAQSTFRS